MDGATDGANGGVVDGYGEYDGALEGKNDGVEDGRGGS